MNRKPDMHAVVALLEEVPTKDFSTARQLLLHRGQIGTVVMIYPDGACEVEFAAATAGRTQYCRSSRTG
jgi:Domain of unknown function (DUF4926)